MLLGCYSFRGNVAFYAVFLYRFADCGGRASSKKSNFCIAHAFADPLAQPFHIVDCTYEVPARSWSRRSVIMGAEFHGIATPTNRNVVAFQRRVYSCTSAAN
jgi:hypothetical protein